VTTAAVVVVVPFRVSLPPTLTRWDAERAFELGPFEHAPSSRPEIITPDTIARRCPLTRPASGQEPALRSSELLIAEGASVSELG